MKREATPVKFKIGKPGLITYRTGLKAYSRRFSGNGFIVDVEETLSPAKGFERGFRPEITVSGSYHGKSGKLFESLPIKQFFSWSAAEKFALKLIRGSN